MSASSTNNPSSSLLAIPANNADAIPNSVPSESLKSDQIFKPNQFRHRYTLWRLKTILSCAFILLSTLPIYFATQYLYELRAGEFRNIKTEQLYSYSEAIKASILHSVLGIKEKAVLMRCSTF